VTGCCLHEDPPRRPISNEERPPLPQAAPAATASPALDLSHEWVVAADIPVDIGGAKLADMRRFHVVRAATKVKATDVYCHACRRTFSDVADTECPAKARDNEHLIGGDQAHRAKRKPVVVPANATRIQGPKIDRRGVRAIVLGE
jgi:hypothetical protein